MGILNLALWKATKLSTREEEKIQIARNLHFRSVWPGWVFVLSKVRKRNETIYFRSGRKHTAYSFTFRGRGGDISIYLYMLYMIFKAI